MKKLLNIAGIIGGLALCVGIWYWVDLRSRESKSQKAKPQRDERLAVQVTRIQQRPLEDRVELVGRVEAISQVEIRARVSGYITDLPFDIDDEVPAGKTVVQLDSSRQQDMVKQMEATLQVAQAQLKSKRVSEQHSEKELKRLEQLREQQVATDQQLDEAKSQLSIAQAEVELQVARVAESQSELNRTRLALSDYRMTTPLAGRVASRNVHIGDLANPGEVLMRIVSLRKMKTIVHVVEKDYEKVRHGQIATIRSDAFPGREFQGKVIRKAPALDPSTRTAEVQIEVDNVDDALKPGMYARVKLVFARRPGAEVVPITSLLAHGKNATLYVLQGDPPQTKLRDVVTGINDGEMVEVLSGLEPTDRVVTLGTRLVKPGQTVLVVGDEEEELSGADSAAKIAGRGQAERSKGN